MKLTEFEIIDVFTEEKRMNLENLAKRILKKPRL